MKQVLRVVFVCSLVFLAAAPAAVARTATLGWVTQSSPTTSRLTAVSAADAHDVWAVGASSTLLATTTGGSAWQVGTDPSAYAGSEYFYDVAAVAPGVCRAVGANGIILKDTAGSDWVQRTFAIPQRSRRCDCRGSNGTPGSAAARHSCSSPPTAVRNGPCRRRPTKPRAASRLRTSRSPTPSTAGRWAGKARSSPPRTAARRGRPRHHRLR